jgi:hypothetical protein
MFLKCLNEGVKEGLKLSLNFLIQIQFNQRRNKNCFFHFQNIREYCSTEGLTMAAGKILS